jgi:hypothetical protein
MKLILVLLLLAFAITGQAAPVANSAARLELQKLLFGNETSKTETVRIDGRQSDGQACAIELRKTRYGVYVSVTSLAGEGDITVGLTNSDYTTQDLDFAMNGREISFSRLGIVNIDERGEDHGHETARLVLENTDAVPAKVQSLVLSYQELAAHYNSADGSITHTPQGDFHTIDCTAR